jgi:hypothetical protein
LSEYDSFRLSFSIVGFLLLERANGRPSIYPECPSFLAKCLGLSRVYPAKEKRLFQFEFELRILGILYR